MKQEENFVLGFTCGAMDVMHSGHDIMLAECKQNCDYLIVGLHTNPQLDRPEKNKPIQSLMERFIQLRENKSVDEIVIYETEEDLLTMLAYINPDVRFIGEDHINNDYTGKELCEELRVDIHWNKRRHNYSSSGLRRRIANAENK